MADKKPRKKKADPAPAALAESIDVEAAPVVEEQRVETPEAEAISLSIAEEVGALPEEDRRAPEAVVPELSAILVEAAPLVPNDQIHVVREREDGKKVNALGSILE